MFVTFSVSPLNRSLGFFWRRGGWHVTLSYTLIGVIVFLCSSLSACDVLYVCVDWMQLAGVVTCYPLGVGDRSEYPSVDNDNNNDDDNNNNNKHPRNTWF